MREPCVLQARGLGEAPGTYQALFLCRGVYADDHDGFAQLLHAADDVPGAGGLPIPERHQHVASLRQLLSTADACGPAKARPRGGEAARAHMVPDGPAKAELVGPARAAVQHLRDAMATGPSTWVRSA